MKVRGPRPRRKRIPALEIEAAVKSAVHDLVQNSTRLLDVLHITGAEDTAHALAAASKLLRALDADGPAIGANALRPLLNQVICRNDRLIIRFDHAAFLTRLGLSHLCLSDDSSPNPPDPEIIVPISIRTRGVEMKLILPGSNGDTTPRTPDPALIKAVARGYRWFRMLRDGDAPSVGAIAAAEGITTSFISRTMRLAFLSPALIEQILDGTQPPDMTVDWLMMSGNVPVSWENILIKPNHTLLKG